MLVNGAPLFHGLRRTVLIGVENVVVCIAQSKVVRNRRRLLPIEIASCVGARQRLEEVSLRFGRAAYSTVSAAYGFL